MPKQIQRSQGRLRQFGLDQATLQDFVWWAGLTVARLQVLPGG